VSRCATRATWCLVRALDVPLGLGRRARHAAAVVLVATGLGQPQRCATAGLTVTVITAKFVTQTLAQLQNRQLYARIEGCGRLIGD
jgi:hypothetical protein